VNPDQRRAARVDRLPEKQHRHIAGHLQAARLQRECEFVRCVLWCDEDRGEPTLRDLLRSDGHIVHVDEAQWQTMCSHRLPVAFHSVERRLVRALRSGVTDAPVTGCDQAFDLPRRRSDVVGADVREHPSLADALADEHERVVRVEEMLQFPLIFVLSEEQTAVGDSEPLPSVA